VVLVLEVGAAYRMTYFVVEDNMHEIKMGLWLLVLAGGAHHILSQLEFMALSLGHNLKLLLLVSMLYSC
jgi:hypothetical protein